MNTAKCGIYQLQGQLPTLVLKRKIKRGGEGTKWRKQSFRNASIFFYCCFENVKAVLRIYS
jgi:hypothetical protein